MGAAAATPSQAQNIGLGGGMPQPIYDKTFCIFSTGGEERLRSLFQNQNKGQNYAQGMANRYRQIVYYDCVSRGLGRKNGTKFPRR